MLLGVIRYSFALKIDKGQLSFFIQNTVSNMTENYQTALMLMLTGMITVFTILFLVIIVSKILIFVINKYFYEEILIDQPGYFSSSNIEGKKISAIVTAIDLTTKGKARIEKIEKL